MSENKAGITGKITAAPESVTLYGLNGLFKAHVNVCRNSGLSDDVIIIFPAKVVDTAGHDEAAFLEPQDLLTIGKDVVIIGKLQTMRNAQQGIVDTYIYCDYIGVGYAEPQNEIRFTGTIEREPVNRKTPKGRNLTDLIIRVPSIYASSFYCKVPVIAWNKGADIAAQFKAGDVVEVRGRLQSRPYTKRYEDGTTEEKTATEISANNIALYKKE